MTTELSILAWTLVLVLVQVLLPSVVRSREAGIGYNASARDGPAPPPGKVTARLLRAQNNLFETLPVFAFAIIITHLAGRDGPLTVWGAWIYLIARLVYLPVYAAGIPFIRSLVWMVSLLGIVLVMVPIL
jgi:uncharacterized MAPEG superfamily protein